MTASSGERPRPPVRRERCRDRLAPTVHEQTLPLRTEVPEDGYQAAAVALHWNLVMLILDA